MVENAYKPTLRGFVIDRAAPRTPPYPGVRVQPTRGCPYLVMRSSARSSSSIGGRRARTAWRRSGACHSAHTSASTARCLRITFPLRNRIPRTPPRPRIRHDRPDGRRRRGHGRESTPPQRPHQAQHVAKRSAWGVMTRSNILREGSKPMRREVQNGVPATISLSARASGGTTRYSRKSFALRCGCIRHCGRRLQGACSGAMCRRGGTRCWRRISGPALTAVR